MTKKLNPTTEAQRQALLHILLEVAQASADIVMLSGLVADYEGDGAAVSALNASIAAQARRAGWLADLATVNLGGKSIVHGDDAKAWFMSPTMAAAIEAASTNQSSNVNANGDQHA